MEMLELDRQVSWYYYTGLYSLRRAMIRPKWRALQILYLV